MRAVWYTKSLTDAMPRGAVHATHDDETTVCGIAVRDDGMWWLGDDEPVSCAKCTLKDTNHEAHHESP